MRKKMRFMTIVVPERSANKILSGLPSDAVYWSDGIEVERLDIIEYVRAAGLIAATEVFKERQRIRAEGRKPVEQHVEGPAAA